MNSETLERLLMDQRFGELTPDMSALLEDYLQAKPEAALAKIVEGRVNAFFKDFVLLEQASVQDQKKSVRQILGEAGITVSRFVRFEVGQA